MFLQDLKRVCELNQWNGLRSLQAIVVPGVWATAVYRFGSFWNRFPIPVVKQVGMIVAWVFKLGIELSWGISISPKARIGAGLFINHFGCIFVHRDAVIGARCVLSQEVTIGVKGNTNSGAPVLGDDVIVGAGAKVLGPVRVGKGAVIGANAAVVKDVEENTIVGGVPAVVIKRQV